MAKRIPNWRFVTVFALMAIGYPVMLYSFFFGTFINEAGIPYPLFFFKSDLLRLGFFGGGAVGSIGMILMLENFGTFGSFTYKQEKET